jgi:hypothetical protein
MKFAEKEIEQLEMKAREEAGLAFESSEEGRTLPPIKLPEFSIMREQLRIRKKKQSEVDKKQLEEKVAEVEGQLQEVQDKLKALNDNCLAITSSPMREASEKANNAASEKENHQSRDSVGKNGYDDTGTSDIPPDNENGAVGPDGKFVEFPDYTGTEPPKESKKAFTHFCLHTKKEVKASLDLTERKNKVCIFCRVVEIVLT